MGNSHGLFPRGWLARDRSHLSQDETVSEAEPSGKEHLPSPAPGRLTLGQKEAEQGQCWGAGLHPAVLGSCFIPVPEREQKEKANGSPPEQGTSSPGSPHRVWRPGSVLVTVRVGGAGEPRQREHAWEQTARLLSRLLSGAAKIDVKTKVK